MKQQNDRGVLPYLALHLGDPQKRVTAAPQNRRLCRAGMHAFRNEFGMSGSAALSRLRTARAANDAASAG